MVGASGLHTGADAAFHRISTIRRHLQKPYTAEVLLQAVRSALDEAAGRPRTEGPRVS